jgi:ABC-type phosphate transport system substrate-binding protein
LVAWPDSREKQGEQPLVVRNIVPQTELMEREKIMPHKILATIALVGMLIALVNCGSRPSQMPEPTVSSAQVVLRISGSGTTTPILSAVKPAFEADIPDYCLELLPGSGTGGGVKGLTEGILDVAAMARPAKDEEAAQGVEYVEFGQSGVAVLVHPSVDVANLTRAQIVAIFSGEITNWSQVGGLDLNLMMYVRDEGESST